ncbi:MAG TPA: hypothetical protein VMW62_10375 [Chloroflexota bacterium]|nr:hypothetical protein [Chloroflexota bacterium]
MTERLLVLAVVFTMALGLSLTLSPGVLPFYAVALAVLACAAVPYLLHAHPAYKFSAVRLMLPAAIALVAPSIAHDLGAGPFRLAAVFGPGALLYGVIYAEYLLIRPTAEMPVQAARLLIIMAAYGAALGCYLLTYEQKERSVISGPLVAAISAGLALRLLGLDRWVDWRVGWYAGAAGLAMAEVLWPLNYWILGVTAGGLALLLVFYVLVGLMRQLLAGQLSRAVLLEYGSVSLAGLLVIFGATRI